MPSNSPIILDILPSGVWAFVISVFLFLTAMSLVQASHPGLALALFLIALGFVRISSILGLFEIKKGKLTLVIFADGQLRLSFANKIKIEGFLGPQQWCTSHAAVLKVFIGGKARNLVVFSALQKNKNDYRRLMMWLRQDIYRDTEGVQVSGN
jgi:hypothetical protein